MIRSFFICGHMLKEIKRIKRLYLKLYPLHRAFIHGGILMTIFLLATKSLIFSIQKGIKQQLIAIELDMEN